MRVAPAGAEQLFEQCNCYGIGLIDTINPIFVCLDHKELFFLDLMHLLYTISTLSLVGMYLD